MSLIHPQSCESLTSQIDLFTIPPTNTALNDGYYEQFHPIATLSDNSPIEFAINGSDFLDLAHSYINVRAKIVKKDGTKLDAAAAVAPVNLWLHSLFSQVDISLNGKLITPSTNTYPYRSYVETLINYGWEAKNSHLTAAGWQMDDPKEFDLLTDGNAGFVKRKERSKLSNEIDMLGRIHADIFHQDRYILSGVEVKIRLIRSKDAFSLMAANLNDAKVSIKEASLYVRKIKLDPTVELAIMKSLEKGTAKYPINRVETKVYSIPNGSLSNTQQNLVLGQLPKRMIVGFVENAALNGDATKNPFNFRHFKINYLAVHINGKQYPSKPFTPDFPKGLYARSYMTMFYDNSRANQDFGNNVKYEDYGGGYTLFSFNFSPDLVESAGEFDLIQTGNLALECHFAEALTTTVNVVCILERPNMIEIDKSRNVVTDYSA